MKKKALVLAVYMACTTPNTGIAKNPGNAFNALNLGEVQSHSNLGEPFTGVIPILFTSAKQAKQLKIRLAPKSVFSRLGAEKSAELQYLKFQIKSYRNKPVIAISSTQAINTPILNFILEIESPKGITYQDYTVMLDPPKSQSKKINKTSHSSAKSKKTLPKPSHSTKKTRSKYTVKTGDTLSIIAMQHKHSGISLKQMMLGIYYRNPNAFLHNNLNEIKKGALLKIPSSKKIRKLLKVRQEQSNKASIKPKKTTRGINHQTKPLHKNSIHHYKVKRGDTLSQITKNHVYKGVSFSKMMKAIFKANPHAFSKNKMNVLLAGAQLRIPAYTEVTNKQQSPIAELDIKNTSSKVAEHSKPQKNRQLKKQAVFKSVLEKKSEKQASNSLNTTGSDSNLPTKKHSTIHSLHETKNEELIQNLQDSNTTINRLQKRIRELRSNLSLISADYQNLSEVLSDESFLKTIKQDQNHKPILTLVNEYKTRKQTARLPQTASTLPASTRRIKTNHSVMSSKVDTKQLNNKIATAENLSLDDYSYIVIALLLGIVLIRYRENIYSYNSIPYDQPKFYPPAQEQMTEAEKELVSLSENPTELPDNDENTAKNKTLNNFKQYEIPKDKIKFPEKNLLPKANIKKEQQPLDIPDEISDKSLQECETLIDELILELAKKTNTESKSKQLDLKLNHLTELELETSPMKKSTENEILPSSEKQEDLLIKTLEKELHESTIKTEKLWKDQEALMDNSTSTKAS